MQADDDCNDTVSPKVDCRPANAADSSAGDDSGRNEADLAEHPATTTEPPAPASAGPPDQSEPPLEPYHCGAKNRAGKPCRARAIMPSGRCKNHGGKSLSGVASKTFKHGRYSKHFLAAMPERFRDRFEQAMSDPELLSMRSSVALLDLRLVDVLERFSASDAGQFRSLLLATWSKFKTTNATKADTDEARAAKAVKVGDLLRELDRIIAAGASESDAWQDVAAAIRDRTALVVQENRRLVDMGQMLTVVQAMDLVIKVYDAVKRAVPDAATLSRVAAELGQATGLDRRTLELPAPVSAPASGGEES